jgi:hypothetical protein
MVIIGAVVLSLPFAQLPVTTAKATTICEYEAAYPPDLPDCLSPVVAAEQAAAAAATRAAQNAAAERAAAERAAAERAAQNAAAERAAAEVARIKAASDKAAADALAEKIRDGKLADAAIEAAAAALEARRVAGLAEDAKRIANEELTRKIDEQAAAQAAIVVAQAALAAAQERIAREIEEANAEANRQREIIREKRASFDASRAALAADRLILNQAIAEAQALRIAKEAEARASASATQNALDAYNAELRSTSLRMADSQISSQSVTIKKQELLTDFLPQSNLKIQSSTTPLFVDAGVLASLLAAYNALKIISDEASAAATVALTAENATTAALTRRVAIAATEQAPFLDAVAARDTAITAATTAALERTTLENAIKAREVEALEADARKVAAEADLARKSAAELVARNAAASIESASVILAGAASDSSNSASLASQAFDLFQNVAVASNAASNAAATAAAAADRASSAAAAVVRAREEAEAAALAARTPSSSASIASAQARAAQEAENKAKELERQAQEAARLAEEAKTAEKKATAEKLAAEEAAAKAKAAADRAAAESQTKEEAKRKAARNQIEKDKTTVKKLVEKIKDTAEKTGKSLNKSSEAINLAYESAISEAAKSNKALATLKKQESLALANLNYAKNELLALGNALKKAADNQKVAITEFGNAQYKVVQLQIEIDSTKSQLTSIGSEIKGLEVNYKELSTKYDSLNKVAQSAISAAEASKKNAEIAYKALLQATNSNNLVVKNLEVELNSDKENFIPEANATSALNKIIEAYQNAQKQANKDKVLADRATKDAATAREALLKAKQVFQNKQDERNSLEASLENLTLKLVVAKTELVSASAAKVKAVDSFTKASNKLAAVTDRFREKELLYESAKSNTKFEFENSSSKNNQVLALKKLSDWSKTSVAAAKDVITAIDEEVRNLENSQALDLLNQDISIGFISISIPLFIFTVTAIAAIYAYLARRKRRSKFDLVSNEMLAKILEQQEAAAIKEKNVKE